MKNKVLFIVGPTAVGKTDLALDIAKKVNGELISSDSVQVFKGLDIVSGKDLPPEYTHYAGYYHSHSGPSIHLLDVVNPTDPFSVEEFIKLARKSMQNIFERNRVPVVVGGSGLYVKALIDGLSVRVEPNEQLRKELSELDTNQLQNMLRDLNKKQLDDMNESDKANPRRLIRKIELNKAKNNNDVTETNPAHDYYMVGLKCDRELLKKRIDKRVENRIEHGAIDEVRKLFASYAELTQQVKDANGYKQLFSYLNGEIDYEEAMYRWKLSEYKHAKNQMTWFQKYGNVEWFDINDNNYRAKIMQNVKLFLNEE